MPIKKSAILLIILAMGSVSLLVFSAEKITPSAKPRNCCQKQNETELFSPRSGQWVSGALLHVWPIGRETAGRQPHCALERQQLPKAQPAKRAVSLCLARQSV